MTIHQKHLAAYLEHYAEPAVDELAPFISAHFPTTQMFKHCLIIPAYNESHEFIASLLLKLDDKKWENTLIIVVVNQPDSDKNTRVNKNFWDSVQQLPLKRTVEKSVQQELFLKLDHKHSGSSIMLLDFFTQARKLPHKKGVGLARKIGCDFACLLSQQKIFTSQWLHTSDADTSLPDNYFQQTSSLAPHNISAAVYDFAHMGAKNKITASTQLYEDSIDYYVSGLRYAGSPYAYHTLGSCIAIKIIPYISVRGFTKRAGGEDFYCLNKLAKVGVIKQLKGDKLIIATRESDRVPFGTGPAVKQIIENASTHSTLLTYNPRIFFELKNLLQSFSNLFDYKNNRNSWLTQQTIETQNALQNLHIDTLFDHIDLQINDQQLCLSHIHQWFDAFKTLRFIHLLESDFPKVDLQKAKNQLDAGF